MSNKSIEIISIRNISILTVADYVDQFNQFSHKTAQNIVGMAETVYRAKSNLDTGKGKHKTHRFQEFCKGIRYESKSSAIRKFLKIGEMADMLKRHTDQIPNNWTTLYQLTRLGVATLERLIEEQRIVASLTAKQAKLLLDHETGSTKTRNSDEDDSHLQTPEVQDTSYSLTIQFDQAPSPSLALQIEDLVQKFINREQMSARCLRSMAMDQSVELYLANLQVAA